MTADASRIVNKLWSYCNVLRDDGLSYGDYLEQLTYLLFLKMADEQTQPPWRKPSPVPEGYDWPSLTARDGADLEHHYRELLEHLGKQHGLLGLVFRKAQNKIQDPAKLKRLVSDLIDKEQWVMVGADIKGDAYEGLLERNAQDTKSGAGQYFTPRPLIDAVVAAVAPKPGETLVDPACGTGGFLLAAHHWLTTQHPDLTREQREHLRLDALRGVEIVQGVTRLCAMNLLLHNVGPTPQELETLRRLLIEEGSSPEQADAAIGRRLPVRTDDGLRELGSDRFDVVLTNPPFGRKSSILIVGEDGDSERESIAYEREDFWATTTNKQLNFVQHVKSLLKIHGRAAVVVPDNVLFEGGAGETIRRKLLAECDVHTLLRLPTGIFYAQGVKANVLFFDRKPASPKPWTRKLWVYDLRTNQHFTLKTHPMRAGHLEEFVSLYRSGDLAGRQETWSAPYQPNGRWRAYDYEDVINRDKCSLDLFWLKDISLLDAENLPEPDDIAAEIAEDLRAALEQVEAILGDLGEAARESCATPGEAPPVTQHLGDYVVRVRMGEDVHERYAVGLLEWPDKLGFLQPGFLDPHPAATPQWHEEEEPVVRDGSILRCGRLTVDLDERPRGGMARDVEFLNAYLKQEGKDRGEVVGDTLDFLVREDIRLRALNVSQFETSSSDRD